ncbi:MAG: methyltransferase family protein [Candidatus Hodarchaeota archaeon]
MTLRNFLLDLFPRIMWIVQVVVIIIVSKAVLKEGFELVNDVLLLAISFVLITAGVTLFCWSQYYLFRHWKRFIPTKVVREGPFRWIRHPVYVGLYAVILGFGLLLSSFAAAFTVSACFLPFWIFQSLFEEQQMIELFGDDYQQYKSDVGMFFPKIRRRKEMLISSNNS